MDKPKAFKCSGSRRAPAAIGVVDVNTDRYKVRCDRCARMFRGVRNAGGWLIVPNHLERVK
jgi:hypothetical protein